MKNTGRKTVKGGKTSAPMMAKATQQQAVSGTPVVPTTAQRVPTREDIARRSYQLYLEGGGEHGHDLEHWAQAERDLLGLLG